MERKWTKRKDGTFAPGPILSKFVGAPFKIGGRDKNEGFDSFSFFYLLYKERGYSVPFSFDFVGASDVNFDNYAELWEKDPQRIDSLIWSYILGVTEPVDNLGYMQCGDLVVVEDGSEDYHICIWAGNDALVIALVGYGVHVIDRRYFRVVEGRKWASQ